MKFTVSREALETELQFLQGVAEKKKTIPILSNILIRSEGSGEEAKLRLAATDLEVSLTTTCSAAVSEEGAITVSSKKLFEVVRSLPGDTVEFSLGDGNRLAVRCGKAFFNLVGLPGADFPEIPEASFDGAVKIPYKLIREMIARTLFAVTKEDVRYSLNGALLEIGEGEVRMVATDAHRLAIVEKKGADVDPAVTVSAIVPKKALAELRDLGTEEELAFAQDEHHLYFVVDHRVLATRVIEGQFPAWEKVIPAENPGEVIFVAETMAAAIRRVSLLASERSRAIKFVFGAGEAKITSSNPELGDAEESVPVEFNGPATTVSFNAQYILDFLSVAATDQAIFRIKDDSSQGMLVPVDSADGIDYRYVVMPMRI